MPINTLGWELVWRKHGVPPRDITVEDLNRRLHSGKKGQTEGGEALPSLDNASGQPSVASVELCADAR
jgi:hypothetical protein